MTPTPAHASVAPSVVAVMAHPDDAELWAGGTLALHAAAGAAVHVVVPRHPEPERNLEAAAAAAALGATLHQPDRIEPSWLVGHIVAHQPHVLITHHLRDAHPDHRHAAEVVTQAIPDAVITCGHPRRAYSCDTYNSLTLDGPAHAHTIIDVTDTWDTKVQALAMHASQPIDTHFAPMADTLSRLWGARIGTTRAEAFTPLPILGRLPGQTAL